MKMRSGGYSMKDMQDNSRGEIFDNNGAQMLGSFLDLTHTHPHTIKFRLSTTSAKLHNSKVQTSYAGSFFFYLSTLLFYAGPLASSFSTLL